MPTGTINSPDAISSSARTLRLKLLPSEGKLVGKIDAMDLTTDREGSVPFVINLSRVNRG
jgi:hypothetical protein